MLFLSFGGHWAMQAIIGIALPPRPKKLTEIVVRLYTYILMELSDSVMDYN